MPRLALLPRQEQHTPMRTNPKTLVLLAVSGVALFTSVSSSACSFARKSLTSAQVRQQARDDFRRASAVIDAEVIAPMRFGPDWKSGLTPIAYLWASKTWKGRVQQDGVPIVYLTSCDIGLTAKGEKLRLLLTGEGIFRADQGMNGGGIVDLPTYNAEIDRLVGRRRSPALAHLPGALLPPTRKQTSGHRR